ncbi:MAG: M48 family metalloprotease [Desulfarculales bacterium]|jgi:predicted Zn-dependent protease|nr:M48 family metalloprotease [Desulfarculales bacterium]
MNRRSIFRGLILPLCLFIILPTSSLSAAVSLAEERRMARQALFEVMDEIPMITDPDSVDYVRSLGAALASHLQDDPFRYHFWLVDVQVMNAFALPAGYVFIFCGMFTALESEDELAGIMAHEISHAHLHHVVRRMDMSSGAQKLSLAAMLAGILLGALSGGALTSAAIMGSVAGSIQSQIAFTREFEEEADGYGFLLMTGSGYSGQGMVDSFGRLWRQERLTGGGNIPEYLRTHPASAARMERMESMLSRYPHGKSDGDNREFLRVKTRLQAMYLSIADAYDLFRSRVRQNPADAMAQYGLALVEIRQGNYRQAEEIALNLEKIWPEGRPFIYKLRAAICLLHGDFTAAGNFYQEVVRIRPHDREALSGLGESLLNLNRFQEAVDNLSAALRLNPQDEAVRYNLGMALGKMGRSAEAGAQLGLTFFQRKNDKAASYHLQMASDKLSSGSELDEQVKEALDRLNTSRNLSQKDLDELWDKRIESDYNKVWRQVPPPPWSREF